MGLCSEKNLTCQALIGHCLQRHASSGRVAAVCPICASVPWGDPNYVSRDFLSHIQLRHKCDYEVLTDFEASEEELLKRALQASAASAAFDESVEDAILARVLEESSREVGISSGTGLLAASSNSNVVADVSVAWSAREIAEDEPFSTQARFLQCGSRWPCKKRRG